MLVIYSIVNILAAGCVGFPTLTPYILSVKNGQCGEYQSVGTESSCSENFQFVKWHPMSDCDGFYALSAQDVANLKAYQKKQCSSTTTGTAQ
jgi:hypothetical protein